MDDIVFINHRHLLPIAITGANHEGAGETPAPLYPLQDFKALYKYCIIIIIIIIIIIFYYYYYKRVSQNLEWGTLMHMYPRFSKKYRSEFTKHAISREFFFPERSLADSPNLSLVDPLLATNQAFWVVRLCVSWEFHPDSCPLETLLSPADTVEVACHET